MIEYIIKRVLWSIPTLVAISMIAFIVIQLPPGDFLTSYVARLRAEEGDQVADEALESGYLGALRDRYGLDKPVIVQYWKWITNIVLRGDFGYSFAMKIGVKTLIWQRLALTVMLSGATMLFTWVVAIPIGVLSAVRQYSAADYFFTSIGFIGLAVPSFLLALILMWIAYRYFDTSITGLFSPEYIDAPWTWGKFVDMAKHIWLPIVILGLSGSAGLIRTMRANLLDELSKPYVEAARAKGVKESVVIWKYPVRMALNPFVSTIGWALPRLVSGSTIVSVVLSLSTTGPLLLHALRTQDMYLAGAFILMLSVLTVIGTLVSDILLAVLDPRIAYR